MSGVLVDLKSPGDFWKKDPDLTRQQAKVVKGLVRRKRPLVGGTRIVGPVVGKTGGGSSINTSSTSSGGAISTGSGTITSGIEWQGTLGVLLEDANFPDVAYGLTSLHVLEKGATAAGLTLTLGHSVSQPMQTYSGGIMAGMFRIGWLIAMYKEFDLALIGIRPGMRWKPQIEEIGETRGGQPFLDSFDPASHTGNPGPRTVEMWTFNPEPVLGSLPSSGPVVRKVGQRTGLTQGRAYRLIGVTGKYQAVLKSIADGGKGTNSQAWTLLRDRYKNDPTMADSVIEALSINPVLYLCVPDQIGSSTDLTTFQQTGDSGSALVDEGGVVVGIVQDVVRDNSTTTMAKKWIAGLALPIDLALGPLQEEIDREYGKTGAPPDWPMLRIPDVPPGSPTRRVPKRPQPPKWYQLALSQIQKVNP